MKILRYLAFAFASAIIWIDQVPEIVREILLIPIALSFFYILGTCWRCGRWVGMLGWCRGRCDSNLDKR